MISTQRRRSRFCIPALLAIALCIAAFGSALAAPVLMISIDGMKPEYVTQADAHGLRIPFLRGMMRDGAYASGVIGVWPTITYPSHTTMITGVSPAEHGIYSNTIFDPMRESGGAWYWYAEQIRAPTLWQAARAAGLQTASVGWPVSVNAGVDFLIPEYWREDSPGPVAQASDSYLATAISRPDGMLDQMARRLGPFSMVGEPTVASDEVKTRYSIDILRAHKPGLMTIHLSSLDAVEHEHGAFSPEANQTLETIDGMVARLAAAARAANPASVILIVSDHGFIPVTHHLNLTIPFLKAGLIQTTGAGDHLAIANWKAQVWTAGGMAAIMLHNPNDQQTTAQTADLLHNLAADPNNGIAAVLDHDQIQKRGGFPDAAFLVVFKPGYYAGDAESGDLVTPIEGSHGGHGFSPELPGMRASFFLAGPGIARHRDLGLIDMRQIAPTVAAILHVSLPAAKAPALSVRP